MKVFYKVHAVHHDVEVVAPVLDLGRVAVPVEILDHEGVQLEHVAKRSVDLFGALVRVEPHGGPRLREDPRELREVRELLVPLRAEHVCDGAHELPCSVGYHGRRRAVGPRGLGRARTGVEATESRYRARGSTRR